MKTFHRAPVGMAVILKRYYDVDVSRFLREVSRFRQVRCHHEDVVQSMHGFFEKNRGMSRKAIKESRLGREEGIFGLPDWAMNRLEPLRLFPGEGSPARRPEHGALRSWQRSPTGQTEDEPLASDSDDERGAI